jgi:stage II sporulation protein M
MLQHVKSNANRYFLLFLTFILGVSAGAFTVNGLSTIQSDELNNYLQGFIQLMDNQNIDSNELLRISSLENIKILSTLWVLGVTIIGIPFIFIIVGVKGFITGFSAGFIIKLLGLKGVLFTALALLPKEFFIVPCIIALGVNGMNFSFNIIKSKSIKHMLKENLKARFAGYCLVTLLFGCVMFAGILLEAYVVPVFIRMMGPLIST